MDLSRLYIIYLELVAFKLQSVFVGKLILDTKPDYLVDFLSLEMSVDSEAGGKNSGKSLRAKQRILFLHPILYCYDLPRRTCLFFPW